jgi:hypothetical protein
VRTSLKEVARGILDKDVADEALNGTRELADAKKKLLSDPAAAKKIVADLAKRYPKADLTDAAAALEKAADFQIAMKKPKK